jgi:putative ATPase
MPDLFDQQSRSGEPGGRQPLAARMRPVTLDEFVGQQHIVGEGTLLRRAIESDELPSLILYGPPGSGKTTLAAIIQNSSKAAFESFSAVMSGVAEIREVIRRARERRKLYGQRTILFVDEIHRFNKAQQDAFLPHIEDGTIILLGATTENPYFEINSPIISRARVFQLQPLSREDMKTLVLRALQDRERGLGELECSLEEDALEHLVDVAGGDARAALNALEAAALNCPPSPDGRRNITRQMVEDALQQRALGHDKAGDSHYNTISAFIKSMRGSDPDAAVYWLARMLAAGEDPRFIARRIVIQAAEDVGNADPMALVIATAAAHAVEYVGMPEAQIPLAQAAIYLACAPKSNASYLAINRAMEDVRNRPPAAVPPHLRSTGYRGAEQLGHGVGYLYPHDYPMAQVEQDYLPPGAKSRRYYEPTEHGLERKIAERLKMWKEELARRRREGEHGK